MVIAEEVKSPQQLLTELLSLVQSYNLSKLGTSLTDKLGQVQQLLEASRSREACETLNAFINQVHAQSGKGLTPEQAQELVGRAEEIETAIGC